MTLKREKYRGLFSYKNKNLTFYIIDTAEHNDIDIGYKYHMAYIINKCLNLELTIVDM